MICFIFNSELKLDAPSNFSLHLSHFLHQPSELAEFVSNKMEVFSIQQVEWNVSQVNLRQTSNGTRKKSGEISLCSHPFENGPS